jgi:serine phosphatase RsbU (regulator of sigma subunit)/HAMP domain-containing protein
MTLFHKLWIKISFTVVILIVIIMTLVTYIFTVRQIGAKRIEVQENMGRLAKQIASIRLAETEGWYVYQDWIDNIIHSDFAGDIIYIAIFDEADTLAAFSLNTGFIDMEDSGFMSRQQRINIIRQFSRGDVADESVADFDRQPVDIRWGEEFLGTVEVGFSLIELNNSVQRSLLINLTLLGIFCVIGIIASVLLSRKVTQPLNQLADAMIGVTQGNLDHELILKSQDEVGYLTNTYNDMIRGLRQKELIERFGHELGFIFELGTVANRVLQHICESSHCDCGLLFIKHSDEKFQCWEFRDHAAHQAEPMAFPIEWRPSARDWQSPRSVSELTKQEKKEWTGLCQQWELHDSNIIVPILARNELTCFLILDKKTDGSLYTEEEKKFLSTLSGQAALAIENATLLEELTEKERLKHELDVARNVQMRLLPQSNPKIAGLDIFGLCQPAEEVGGDYYDYFYLDDHRLGIAIGDVSGKGTSAAFYMAEIKGMMISLSMLMSSPKEILMAVNTRFYQSSDRQIFASMIYAIVDLKERKLHFSRAGHMPLMFRNGKPQSKIKFLTPAGFGLGMVDGEVFNANLSEVTLDLNDGGLLLFYTDGVTEAMDKHRQEFGEKRLIDLLEAREKGSMEDLSREILMSIKEFTAGAEQHDDITMIAMRVLQAKN